MRQRRSSRMRMPVNTISISLNRGYSQNQFAIPTLLIADRPRSRSLQAPHSSRFHVRAIEIR